MVTPTPRSASRAEPSAVAGAPAARQPPPSRWNRIWHQTLVRFAAFGVLGLTIDVSLLALLQRYTPVSGLVAVTIAFVVTYGINFVLNRVFSFHARGPVLAQLRRFAPQVTVDYLLTIGAVGVLTHYGVPTLVARVLAGGTNAVFNYLAYRFWTFGHEPARAQPSEAEPWQRRP